MKVASPYPLLDDYQDWLRVHRGLSERTIARHLHHLHKLLPELGAATHDYDAALVRDVVREWRERTGPADLRTITSALRCYLRFLAGAGLCRPNLDHAIPPVLQWRLSSLPQYLAADVERVIESCDQLTRGRLRDRAILLLLARLGLRAGDVAGLRLSDIDWMSGMLRLSGKARRQVRLPLPQNVGDALLAYIEQERPRVHQEAVFLTMVAPYRSFAQSSHVSTIVALALKRAGIRHDGDNPQPGQCRTAPKKHDETDTAPALIRWSVQEIRRVATRMARARIEPSYIIAWSLWRRAHQAAAQQAHIKSKPQL